MKLASIWHALLILVICKKADIFRFVWKTEKVVDKKKWWDKNSRVLSYFYFNCTESGDLPYLSIFAPIKVFLIINYYSKFLI